MKTALPLTSAIIATTLLAAGCSSAGNDEARAAYDACIKPEASVQLLKHTGNKVLIEVTGDAAKALSNVDEEMKSILAGTASDDAGSITGFGVTLAVLSASDCLVEETGYPGKASQLASGDAWDGWTYKESSGAGSESTMAFIATS